MKPIYLEFSGINSFSERAQIDFHSLLSYGIFGIFGDTGSGKSTILDCIGFALYGSVSRASRGVGSDIINFRRDKAFVNFEFEIYYEGKRRYYRAEREIKRKNAMQTLKVYEKSEEGFLVVADTVRDGNRLLSEIIGLEQKDFERCIALPQGEFAQFVKATRAERLKLVSRLFDLEEYGEKLIKKANAKCSASEKELSELTVRMEQFEGVGEEKCRQTEAEIAALQQQETAKKATLSELRAEEKRLSGVLEKQREWRTLGLRLEKLKEKKAEMTVLEGEIGRIAQANSICSAEQETRKAEREAVAAEQTLNRVSQLRLETELRLRQFEAFDEDRAEEEIAMLTALCVRAEQAEKTAQRRATLSKELQATREQYRSEAERFSDFDYEEERKALQEALDALGKGNFLDFAEQQVKTSLLQKEYRVFSSELKELNEKYPIIGQDALPLIEKYEDLADRKTMNFSDARTAYENRETRRNELQAELVALEKKNGLYRSHCERLLQLQTNGKRIKEELSALGEEEPIQESAESCRRLLERKKRERKDRQESRDKILKELSDQTAKCAASEERQKSSAAALKQARERCALLLKEAGFSTFEEAVALKEKYGTGEDAAKSVEKFREEYASVSSRYARLEQERFSGDEEEKLRQVSVSLTECENETEEITKRLALMRDELRRSADALEKKKSIEQQLRKASEQYEIDERLKKLLEGNKFMDFVAEEYLQNVAQNASGRLLTLTDGRYFLKYEGGANGFVVGDNFNGGNTRGVYTMSGGETFLVSLSLALSLSSEICARSLRPIEFFFLDEGFGTLDEKLVDVVMDSLERLKSENFSIGIISHVEELKHRIVKKLLVKKATEEHGSQILA